jgi:ribosomal protein S18 acetylase RimI-like enzyme
MTVAIRPARAADAETLSRLGAETFTATFGHLYSERNLRMFLEKSHSPEAYRELLENPECAAWLAEQGGHGAVAYVTAGPCSLPVPDLPPNSGELMRLYLKKDVQGSGLGARLLETALEFLNDRFDHVYLSVYYENFIAQRLYRRYGFVKVHDYFYMVGEHRDPEWIMKLTAGA